MSSIPPISEVTDALMHAVIPSFGATVAVGGILASLWGRRAGLLTAALAFASGILAGNFFRGCFVFGFQPDTAFRLTDLVRGIGSVILWQTPLVDSGESVSFYFPAAGRWRKADSTVRWQAGGCRVKSSSWRFGLSHLISVGFVLQDNSKADFWIRNL